METQTSIAFGSQTPVRKPIVRKNANQRYDEAIEYLRLELKSGGWSKIRNDEFASTFGITGSFLFMLTEMGALESTSKRGVRNYKALPKLYQLTGLEVLKFRAGIYPNAECVPTAEQNVTVTDTMIQVFEPSELAVSANMLVSNSVPAASPTFLVGSVEYNGTVLKLQTAEGARFTDLDKARSCMNEYPVQPGQKVVLVQVLDVVQLTVAKTPCEL